MKRVILCVCIIFMLLIVGVGSCIYIENTSEKVVNALYLAEDKFSAGDLKGAKIAAETADDNWQDFMSKHIFVTDKEHLLEITAIMVKIQALAAAEDDELLTECDVARRLIELYRDKQSPDLLNIL